MKQLAAGKTKIRVIDYLVAHTAISFFIFPPVNGITLLLWVGPGLLLFSGAGWLAAAPAQARRSNPAAAALNNDQPTAPALCSTAHHCLPEGARS